MLTKSQQSVYRPLVQKAWLEHCRLYEVSPNNRPAYDAWYKDNLHSTIGHWSTRDADPSRDYQPLLNRFMLLAGDPQVIVVEGWSASQSEWFTKEAHKSYEAGRSSGFIQDGIELSEWATSILESHGVLNHHSPDRRVSFDKVMAELATISGDDHLIDHFAQATEIRVRWGITQYMSDLEWLEQQPVTWDYVRAIWKQATLLPNLEEAPAATLITVLQMLDHHIRRRCKALKFSPKCLPTRCDPDRCNGAVDCPGIGHRKRHPVNQDSGPSSDASEIPF